MDANEPRVRGRDGFKRSGRRNIASIEISDGSDPRVRDFMSLTDVALRRVREPVEGLFMAESLEVIKRAIAGGYSVRSILTEPRWLGQVAELALGSSRDQVPVYLAERDVLEQITGYRMHRGLLAAMQRKQQPPSESVIEGAERILVLDGLVDHTNVGASFRSAAAMGMDAVLVTSRCADPLYRRSVRVSMGTVFQVPWTTLGDDALSSVLTDYNTVALTPAAEAEDLTDLVGRLSGPTALVVGSEGPGLSANTLREADHRARIPMAGNVDSLNVAAAVAVACHILANANASRSVAAQLGAERR